MARMVFLFLLICGPAFAATWNDPVIRDKAVWAGEVLVTSPVTVAETGSLVVAAGTRVVFDIPHSGEHLPSVLVKGVLSVEGEESAPVVFTNAHDGSAEDDHDMFEVIAAKKVSFRGARFSGAGWAVHLHEVVGASFVDCLFTGNYGGVRFKSDEMLFSGNVFTDNVIGVRAINSLRPLFKANTFRKNLTGIFFREGIEGAILAGNTFENEEYDIKLGEAQTFDVKADSNVFAGDVAEKIWDALDTPELGRVLLKEER